MKRNTIIAAALMLGLAACSDTSETIGPQMELVDASQIRTTGANIQLIATFKVEIAGGTVYRPQEEPGINSEGKEIGICYEGGRWQNPSTKKFAAKVPHDHCTVVSEERIIGLEPITAAHWTQSHAGGARTSYKLALDEAETLFVIWNSASANAANNKMESGGIVSAHAVDQNGVQYGTFTFNLAQFAEEPDNVNLFGAYEAQTEDGGVNVFGLSRAITATYTHPNGVTEPVEGTLYWTEN